MKLLRRYFLLLNLICCFLNIATVIEKKSNTHWLTVVNLFFNPLVVCALLPQAIKDLPSRKLNLTLNIEENEQP